MAQRGIGPQSNLLVLGLVVVLALLSGAFDDEGEDEDERLVRNFIAATENTMTAKLATIA